MPGYDDIKSSWADEVELDSGGLPPPTETFEKGLKIVTEYKYNNDEKKVKTVRTYKFTKQMVPKSCAKRKTWAKFGDSANDKPGPNPHTTVVPDDVMMNFTTNKEEEKTNEVSDPNKNIAKCRICQAEHWSVNCPYKGTSMDSSKLLETKTVATPSVPESRGSKPDKYVPPFLKDNAKGAMSGVRGRDDTTAIRISNLSESMVEADLEELVKKIGPHSKMYLARDKVNFRLDYFLTVLCNQ